MKVSFSNTLILIFISVFGYGLHAQDDLLVVDDMYGMIDDSSEIIQRSFDTSQLITYKSLPQYNYENDPNYNTSLWSSFKNFITGLIRKAFGEEGARNFWDIFWYSLMLIGLVALVKGLLQMKGSTAFQRTSKEDGIELEKVDEDASLERLKELLATSLQESNYRLATRLKFLIFLKRLDELGAVSLEEFKTNRNIHSEIDSPKLSMEFKEISWIYENVWYGKFSLDREEFQHYADLIGKALEPHEIAE